MKRHPNTRPFQESSNGRTEKKRPPSAPTNTFAPILPIHPAKPLPTVEPEQRCIPPPSGAGLGEAQLLGLAGAADGQQDGVELFALLLAALARRRGAVWQLHLDRLPFEPLAGVCVCVTLGVIGLLLKFAGWYSQILKCTMLLQLNGMIRTNLEVYHVVAVERNETHKPCCCS